MTASEQPSVHDGANNSGGKSEGDFPPQRQHSRWSDERLTLGKQVGNQGAGRLWLATPCSAAPLPRLVCVAWFLLGEERLTWASTVWNCLERFSRISVYIWDSSPRVFIHAPG
jgi:hypothetical protein